MNNFFSKNLKYLREKRRLSQTELADKTNLNQGSIARWEKDEVSPSIDNVVLLSKVLDVSLPEFLGTDLSLNDEFCNEYAVLFDKYKDLNESDRELIKNIIETRKKQIDKELNED